MPLSDHEWVALQMLLKKANDEQQLSQALVTQGLQMPMMPSQAMGVMTDASKGRMDEMSSVAGEEFEFGGGGSSSLAGQTVDPNDVAEQIAASSGPYPVPMPKAAAVPPVVAPVTPAATTPLDAHVLPYQAGFAPVLGEAAFANLEAIDARAYAPRCEVNIPLGPSEIDNEEIQGYELYL